MSDVSRREAFLTLAAGATGATVALGAGARAGPIVTISGGGMPSGRLVARVSAAARRMGGEVERRAGTVVGPATVLQCRSWDQMVYLYLSESVSGFVPVSAAAFAIAAGCQAAGRPVAARVWGHDPQWEDGVGRFDGAMLATDIGDLPTDSSLA